DGNTKSGDGCSSTSQLHIASTRVAPPQTPQPSTTYRYYQRLPPALPATKPETCSVTTCGNGKVEGDEQCDDGNLKAYDGCSPQCQLQPHCPGGTCYAICGDGLVTNYVTTEANGKTLPAEGCDDGNTQ